MQSFFSGPFEYAPGGRARVNGQDRIAWTVAYGTREIATLTLPAAAGHLQVREAFGPIVGLFTRELIEAHLPDRLALCRQADDAVLDAVPVERLPAGLRSCLMDDRNPYWLRVVGTDLRMPVALEEYWTLREQLRAPTHAWIASLLPDEIMTLDAAAWRAPTNWELRHVVGEGSFVEISGARAAALVGVRPQSFRKYTARDGAASQQSMSYAMWHLLLHRLGVKRLPEARDE